MDNKIKLKNVSILFTACHYPGYGGAPTNTYNFIKYIRKRFSTCRVAGLFLRNLFPNRHCIDPENIGGIFYASLHINPKTMSNLSQRIESYFDGKPPSVIFARHLYTPTYCRKLFPNARIVYVASATNYVTKRLKFSPQTPLSAQRILKEDTNNIEPLPLAMLSLELDCIKACDAMVVGSRLAHQMQCKAFASEKYALKKLTGYFDTALLSRQHVFHKRISFEQRHYDLCFVSSHVNRVIKNFAFAHRIMADIRLAPYHKLIVGFGFERYCRESSQTVPLMNTSFVSFVPNEEIQPKVFEKSKIMLLTSFYDCNPNVVQEALYAGCKPLISQNVGYASRLPTLQICDDVYDVNDWVERILTLLNIKKVNVTNNTMDKEAYLEFDQRFAQLVHGENAYK